MVMLLLIKCEVCSNKSRDASLVCVVEDISDLWAMNRSGAFNGVFHVLGGLLTPMEGIGPEELRISNLTERVASGSIKEIVLALGATITGQTTANYIFQELDKYAIKITSLAQGCLLYTSPSPRDSRVSRMPSSA